MPTLVFEKGAVTYTFLVSLDEVDLDALKREAEKAHEAHALSEEMTDEVHALLDDPRFLAELVVGNLFRKIITKARPQGVVIGFHFKRKPVDAEHVAILRQQIESGERAGQLVTVCLEFTRPDLTRPYDTRPYQMPFPHLSWLNSQVRDEPGSGLALLHFTASQIPA